jgi:serine/threonine protein kinase
MNQNIKKSTRCDKCHNELPPDAMAGICPKCLMGLALDGGNPNSTLGATSKSVHLNVDSLIGKFPNLEILHFIGHGGMGAVYLARQTNLDRTVALKILSPQLKQDPTFAERFTREAKTLGKLQHANIVTVFDFGEVDNLHYLVMEYVDGVNLRDAISGGLDSNQSLNVVTQVCNALQYAHEKGVIHRDIKPENILIDKSGQVKIADFGLAKLLDPSVDDFTLTATRQVLGTVNYMAPEQIERPDDVDHRADLYSLGVVLYELLTGELPIGRFAAPSQKSDVSIGLDDVVLKTLEKEPGRRYQQASQFRSAVENAASRKFEAADLSNTNRNNQSENSSADRSGAIRVLPFSHYVNKTGEYGYGLATLKQNEIIFECEPVSSMFGGRIEPGTIPLALEDIASAKFSRGIIEDNIVIQASSISSVSKFPLPKSGAITLYTAKRDRDDAKHFLASLNEHLPESSFTPRRPDDETYTTQSKFENWQVTDLERITTRERLKLARWGLAIAGVSYLLIFATLLILNVRGFCIDLERFGSEIYTTDSPIENKLFRLIFGNSTIRTSNYWISITYATAMSLILGIGSVLISNQLANLRNYHFCLMGSLLLMIGGCYLLANILVLPFLLWTIVVLAIAMTRRVFRAQSIMVATAKPNI